MVVTPALYKTTTSCKQVTTPLFFYLFGLVVKLVLNLVWVFFSKRETTYMLFRLNTVN